MSLLLVFFSLYFTFFRVCWTCWCEQVWLISCTLFVFLALMEYFIVLFGIRYDKHWRKAKPKTPSIPTHNLTSTTASATATTNLSQATENDVSWPFHSMLHLSTILTFPSEFHSLQWRICTRLPFLLDFCFLFGRYFTNFSFFSLLPLSFSWFCYFLPLPQTLSVISFLPFSIFT